MVIADGFAPQFWPLAEKLAEGGLDVVLSPSKRVRGVVRGSTGAPVADAHIVPVTHCLETGFCNQIWLDERSARTNDQGEFEIAALPSIDLSFDILKEGYSESRNVSLKTDGSVNEIRLKTGGAIAGQVLDNDDQPVRNFKIRVQIPRQRDSNERVGGYYAGFDWYGISFTRDDGSFVLTDIPADHWMRLIVSSPGLGRAVLDRVKSEPLDQLSPAEDLPIRLRPFKALTVRVLDADTKTPLADALVTLLEDEPDFSGGIRWGYHDLWVTRARTDAEGKTLFAEPACEDGMVIVSVPGFARRRIAWTDGARELTVALVPGSILKGEVRINGQLLTEGYVRLTSVDKDRYGADLAEATGGFEFDQLAAGEYELTVTNSNGGQLHHEHVTLELQQTKSLNIATSGKLPAAD